MAVLVALALLTPSTGFILDALDMLGMGPREKAWIKSKAIATELLALLVLFATLQSTTALRMAVATGVLVAMIVVLPLVFRAFARIVVPHAPRSEFAFLLMVAVVCAFVTRELGVYYLVGAFVVGMAAQRFRERLPALASEEMIRAVELFASFFIPFYFFNAGLQLRRGDFGLHALLLGGGFLLMMVPLRLITVGVHRRVALRRALPREPADRRAHAADARLRPGHRGDPARALRGAGAVVRGGHPLHARDHHRPGAGLQVAGSRLLGAARASGVTGPGRAAGPGRRVRPRSPSAARGGRGSRGRHEDVRPGVLDHRLGDAPDAGTPDPRPATGPQRDQVGPPAVRLPED